MKRLAMILTLVASLCLPIQAHAASPYDGPPTDLKALELKLLNSIATINCGTKTGIGFAGSYTMSQANKDVGYNSLFVTNQSLIADCITRSYTAIPIEIAGKKTSGKYWSYLTNGYDLGTVINSLNPPTLSLYDNYWPQIGGWVYVAYYVQGFGVVFRSSKIQLVNESLYTLAIDGIVPVPTTGGLVFNSLGNFVGTVTTTGPGNVPTGMLKVHGAPLQCSPAGTEGEAITGCARANINVSARANVWTINPPSGAVSTPTQTPKPTPTPTQQVTNPRELISAQDAALKALSLYDKAVENCFVEFTNMTEEQASEVNILAIFSICGDYADDAESIRGFTEDFDLTSKDISGGVRTLNKYASEVEALTKKVNANRSEVTQSLSSLISINSQILEMKEWLDIVEEQWATLENRLPSIPKTNQSVIKKNSEFKKAQSLVDQIDTVREKVDAKLESFTQASTAKDVKAALASLNLFKSSLRNYQNFSNSVLLVEKLIPEFVCVKGSLVTVTPKTGKCAKGYAKTSTR